MCHQDTWSSHTVLRSNAGDGQRAIHLTSEDHVGDLVSQPLPKELAERRKHAPGTAHIIEIIGWYSALSVNHEARRRLAGETLIDGWTATPAHHQARPTGGPSLMPAFR
jgi:hypothetical protein